MPKKIAAIITEYRLWSHADVIITKWLKGFPTDDGLIPARTQIAALYIDQFSEGDLSRKYAAEYNIPIYNSIRQALTLGGSELAVDGVLLIAEHGDYPWNEKEQQLYPRKPFMEQICAVIATSGRAIPVFNDKHLSYNWADAQWMVERARALSIPFMAGSSLPLGWRSPWLEHELETPIQEAVCLYYSGLDVYGFHALEGLQCMVERRLGGETGVTAVTCLEDAAVWQAINSGQVSRDLVEAACATLTETPREPLEQIFTKPALFLLEYRDGLAGAVLMNNGPEGKITQSGYAARVNNQVVACQLGLYNNPFPHFSYLSLNIEEMFVTGQPSYPVERTLLTSGLTEAVLDSRYRGHVRVETPHLQVAYRAPASIPWRPYNPLPVGAATVPMHF